MQNKADTPEKYIESLPGERREALEKLRKVLKDNLPGGFQEGMGYGMIGYVVPHSLYPSGYHADPRLPLPFINIASQKGHIALYHMGIYANPDLLSWFAAEYSKHSTQKLDMGKSCIRFKKTDDIPYDLIAELARKMTVEDWIALYESSLR